MTGSTFDLSGVHDEHALKASVPPPLAELCVTAIAANFVNRPTLRGIPARYIDRVTELLPAQMALEVTGPLIDDEGYWKRSALARWDNCQISSHGSSWKRLYFERNLEDFLEAFDPLKQDTEELTRLLAVSKDYIFSLHLKQFLSHLDLEMVFQNVPTLCHLDMTYGVKEIGMDYERSLFGMKLNDVASLAKALRVTETLTILSLPCNLLDDSTVRVLATGLQDNVTITSIDLSHNKIADRGVKALAKLLNERSVVLSLNLNDNHIHADGGKYFGRALKLNRCVVAALPRPATPPRPHHNLTPSFPFSQLAAEPQPPAQPAGRRGRQAPPRGPVGELDAHAAQPLVQRTGVRRGDDDAPDRRHLDGAAQPRPLVQPAERGGGPPAARGPPAERHAAVARPAPESDVARHRRRRQRGVQAQPARVRQAAARRAREAASARQGEHRGRAGVRLK